MALSRFCRAGYLPMPTQFALGLSLGLGVLSSYTLAATQVKHQDPLTIIDTRSHSETTAISSRAGLEVSNNVILKAYTPESLELPDVDIKWQITTLQGIQVQEVAGQNQVLQLAEGNYQIRLNIGQFSATKQLVVKTGILSTPYFKADIGRLAIKANHMANWEITGLSPTETKFVIKDSQQLVTWVAAGFYEVTPTHSGVTRRQVVNVLAGDVSSVTIDIPVVQVNLIAVENNQPFFKPVEWSVFRLEKGKRLHIGSYYQHSQGITVPAGYYEVVATHDSIVRSRQFWVKENTTNKIVLAMD